jgi:hypothetical protein
MCNLEYIDLAEEQNRSVFDLYYVSRLIACRKQMVEWRNADIYWRSARDTNVVFTILKICLRSSPAGATDTKPLTFHDSTPFIPTNILRKEKCHAEKPQRQPLCR